MAGTTAQGELVRPSRSRLRFDLAATADDPEIRALLRRNPMPGGIAITLEREPDYFADSSWPGQVKQTVVARVDGKLASVGHCTVRTRYVNGEPRRVGYLGGLRLDAEFSGRHDVLRRGYRFFREIQEVDPADFYFTSIAADNNRARQFLERGLSGMPKYEYLDTFVTLLVPCIHGTKTNAPTQTVSDSTAFRKVANHYNQQCQLAPCWGENELDALGGLGLRPDGFHQIFKQGKPVAQAALWDQRGFKQTVIRGYPRWLAAVRPAANWLANTLGKPTLPAIGDVVSHAFVSHLTFDPDHPNMLPELIEKLRFQGNQVGVHYITLGFVAMDPKLATVRRHFSCREYHTRLYRVRWEGLGGGHRELDGRILAPEVALL